MLLFVCVVVDVVVCVYTVDVGGGERVYVGVVGMGVVVFVCVVVFVIGSVWLLVVRFFGGVSVGVCLLLVVVDARCSCGVSHVIYVGCVRLNWLC